MTVLLAAWIGQRMGNLLFGADVSVPGALGLIGVTEIFGNPATASIADLVTPVGSIVSIALGVLAGVSLYHALAEAPSRLRRGTVGRDAGRPR